VSEPGGLDVDRLGGWLSSLLDLRPPLRVEPIVGGRSNLTSIVTDTDGRSVVVRRPPLSGVLASAHDVVREGRILAALAGTSVPVPEVLAVSTGEELGVPVLVMERVEGTVVRDRRAAEALTVEQRGGLTGSVAATLAAIHTVDIDRVGLGDLARRGGYLARQVARWTRQLEAGTDRALPALHEVARVLAGSIPQGEEVALVHGDYRLDNLVVDTGAGVGPGEGAVRAVLDWELSTLGDPLADLGTLLAYWGVPASPSGPPSVLHPALPTSVVGFASPGELVAAYAHARGLEVEELAERLRPALAFAWFRIACILEGVRIRSAGGAYGPLGEVEREELALLHRLVPALGERALAVVTRRGPLGFDHELT